MRKIFPNNLLAMVGFALLSIGSAEASQAFVDLALYRPSTGQFFIRSSLNGSVTAIQFGAPGDEGLLCKATADALNGGEGLMVFRNGVWFLNIAADGATVDNSFAYGAPTDQPLCGSYGNSTVSEVGLFRGGLWFFSHSTTPTFSFGTVGDVAVHIGAKGLGNAIDRKNVIYGVYRAGVWYLNVSGTNTPNVFHTLGGLSQDIPLLIPAWNGIGEYSIAIYRDGMWYIKPDPNGSTVVTVQFGAIGDIPLVRGGH